MIKVGSYNQLQIARITASGAVFKCDEGDVLLPLRLVPEGVEAGALLNVFVYIDSDGRLTATTRKPRAVVGDFAFLKVKERFSVVLSQASSKTS